jgi:outer membrane protein OmpA-like peptidoglycan-associated protein
VTGSLLGAGLGALIGNDIDDRRCALSKLSKEYEKDYGVGITSEPIKATDVGLKVEPSAQGRQAETVGLKVGLAGLDKQFSANSSELNAKAKEHFNNIASTYTTSSASDTKTRQQQEQLLAQKKIVIIGHSDDTGSSTKNAELAEARAKTVAKLFEEQGVPKTNIYYQGAGDIYPIADNRTLEGQAKNRRVEIVELPSDQSLATYLAKQPKKAEFYQPKTQQSLSKADGIKTANSRATAKQPQTVGVAPEVVPTIQASKGFDLGGVPLANYKSQQNIGALKQSVLASLSPISSAHAGSEYVYQSVCAVDQYREERSVKSLSNGGILNYMQSMTPLVNQHPNLTRCQR